MARGFNIVARLQLQGPTNTQQIVQKLRKDLSSVSVSVDVKVNKTALQQITKINQALDVLKTNLVAVERQSKSTAVALAEISGAFSKLKSGSQTLKETVNQTKQVSRGFREARDTVSDFGKQAGLAIKRATAFTLATGAIFGFVRALTTGVTTALNFQRELVKVSQVTGKSTKELRGLTDEIFRLSSSLGVSSNELLEVTKTLTQAGLSARETKIALEAVAKASLAPSFGDTANVVEGLIAITGQFKNELQGTKIAAKDFESVLGSINKVSADFAVEADDIVTAIRTAGSVFAQASNGLGKPKDQLNELIALFTSVRATTRESAESIATGLRTIFARIQRGNTIDFLKDFNIDLTDTEGKFVGVYEAVGRLNAGLKELNPRDLAFSQIAEELGGIRQLSKILPLIREFGTAQKAYQSALSGSNSLTEQADKAQESLLVQFARVREQFLKLVNDISNTKSFQAFTGFVVNVTNKLLIMADSLKDLLPFIAALGAIKIAGSITGFLGGFRKGLVGQSSKEVGSNIAGTLTGRPSAETNKSVLTLDANTAALKALTGAVVTLTNRIALSPAKPLKFASGGFVPGSGNTDSVPAMLTPGEYVLNKRATRAVFGKRNFATGGPATKLTQKEIDAIVDELSQQFDLNFRDPRITKSIKLADFDKFSGAAGTFLGSTREVKFNSSLSHSSSAKKELVAHELFHATDFQNPDKSYLSFSQDKDIAEAVTYYKRQAALGLSQHPDYAGAAEKLPALAGFPERIVFNRGKLSGSKREMLDYLLSGEEVTARAFGRHAVGRPNSSGGIEGPDSPIAKLFKKIRGIRGFVKGGKVESPKELADFLSGKLDLELVDDIEKEKLGQAFDALQASGLSPGQLKQYLQATKGKKEGILKALSFFPQLQGFSSQVGSKVQGGIKGSGGLVNIPNAFGMAYLDATGLENRKEASVASVLRGEGASFLRKQLEAAGLRLPKGSNTSLIGSDGTTYSGFSAPNFQQSKLVRGRGTFSKIESAIPTLFNKGITRGLGLPPVAEGQAGLEQLLGPSLQGFRGQLFESLLRGASRQFAQKNTEFDFYSPNDTLKSLFKLKGDFPLEVKITNQAGQIGETFSKALRRFGVVGKYARGGQVDTVPAMLTPGEFVVNKAAAQQIGYSKLDKINKGVKGYAHGGVVQNFTRGGVSRPILRAKELTREEEIAFGFDPDEADREDRMAEAVKRAADKKRTRQRKLERAAKRSVTGEIGSSVIPLVTGEQLLSSGYDLTADRESLSRSIQKSQSMRNRSISGQVTGLPYGKTPEPVNERQIMSELADRIKSVRAEFDDLKPTLESLDIVYRDMTTSLVRNRKGVERQSTGATAARDFINNTSLRKNQNQEEAARLAFNNLIPPPPPPPIDPPDVPDYRGQIVSNLVPQIRNRQSLVQEAFNKQGRGSAASNFINTFSKESTSLKEYFQLAKRYSQLLKEGLAPQDAVNKVQKEYLNARKNQISKLNQEEVARLGGGASTSKSKGSGGLGGKLLSDDGFFGSGGSFSRFALFSALGFAGSQIQSRATSAQGAGIGAGLTGAAGGAALGAETGAFLGPQGVALGIAIGGIIGGLNSFKDAVDEFNRDQSLKRMTIAFENATDEFGRIAVDEGKGFQAATKKALDSLFDNSAVESKIDSGKLGVGKAFFGIGTLGGRINNQITDNVTNSARNDIFGTAGALFGGSESFRNFEKKNNQIDRDAFIKRTTGSADFKSLGQEVSQLLAAKPNVNLDKNSLIALGGVTSGIQDKIVEALNRIQISDQDINFDTNKLEEKRQAAIAKVLEAAGKKERDRVVSRVEQERKLNEAFKNSVSIIDILAERVEQLGARMSRVGEILEKAGNRTDALSTQLSGGFAVTNPTQFNPFDNLLSSTVGERGRAINRIGNTFGTSGDPNLQRLLSLVEGVAVVQKDLPEVLSTLKSKESRAEFNTAQLKGLNIDQNIKDVIIASVRKEADSAEPINIQKILDDVTSSKVVKNAPDTLKIIYEQIFKIENAHIDNLKKIYAAREKIEANQNRVDIAARNVLKKSVDRDLTDREFLAPTENRVRRLTGGTTNIGRIQGNITTAASELARGGLSVDREAELSKKLEDNVKALEILSDSTDALALIEEKRSRVESQRNFSKNVTEGIFGGGLEGRVDFFRKLAAGKAFAEGSDKAFSLKSLSGRTFNDTKEAIALRAEFLRSRGKPEEAKSLEDSFTKRAVDALVRQGLDKGTAELLTSFVDEDKKLKALEKTVADKQLEAANALLDMATKVPEILSKIGAEAATKAREFGRREIRGSAIAGADRIPKASGGYISGSGGPTSDHIPAMLSNGEYVIRAAAVKRMGKGALDYINSTGDIPGFAVGGSASQRRTQRIAARRNARAKRMSGLNDAFGTARANFAGGAELFDKNFNYFKNNPDKLLDKDTRRSLQSSKFSGLRNALRQKGILPRFATGGLVRGNAIRSGGTVTQQIITVEASAFNAAANNLAGALNSVRIPENIVMTGTHRVEVVVNGAAVLQNLLEGPIGAFVQTEINNAIRKYITLKNRIEG